MVPRVGISFNNFSYTSIKVSREAFTISFLILSENGDFLFFNFIAALRISLSVIEKGDESVDHDVHILAAHCKRFAGLG